MTFPRFERLERDGSVFRAYGSTRYELFESAAEAMFSVGRDLAAIPSTYSRPLVAPGDTYEELLANWLAELLHLGVHEGLVWSSCMVDRLEVGGVQGSASGLPEADVDRLGEIAVAVDRLESGIVEIPDGWWVEVALELDRGLRVV